MTASLSEDTDSDVQTGQRLSAFLAASDWASALAVWLGKEECERLAADQHALIRRLQQDVADLDARIGEQVNAILHHPDFQALEASWRGLYYLHRTTLALSSRSVQIRVLAITWRELARDLERAIEFDLSHFFQKIYTQEFDMPGGEPYGLLIGDYYVRHRPEPDHPIDDVMVLRSVAEVSAAAFAPFIAGADPALFGLDSFRDLSQPIDLQAIFRQNDGLDYFNWQNLRKSEDSRFIGLTLPRILMRLPYEDDGSRADGFHFRETVEGRDSRNYLWGNAAYAFAAVALQAFDNNGWLADIRGVRQDPETGQLLAAGGLVSGLPVPCFATDRDGLIPKYSTEVMISEYREKELDDLGFISLCHCRDTAWSAFYSNPSIQWPKQYDSDVATVNARLTAMLQYTLCVSRFAHYLKRIGRSKTGSITHAEELENFLSNWLQQYTTSRDTASLAEKARYPLREAKIQIKEYPGKPGSYLCIAHLRPHFQLEQLTAAIRLETEITPTT